MLKEEEFDLAVRKMLEGAEEQVSPDVWEAVSARLGGKAAPTPKRRWALLIAPAACALAGLALLLTLRTPENDAPATGEPLVALSDVQIPEENASAVLPENAPAETVPIAPAEVKMSNCSEGRPVRVAKAMTKEECTGTAAEARAKDGDADAEEKAAVKAQAEAQIPAKSKSEMEEDTGLSLQEALELEQGRRRIAWAVEGSGRLESNDAKSAGRSRLSPGSYVSESEISETSQSVYALPLTLGIGIRAYLTPSLSIASGLNYTLLTRTFKGLFNGDENDITHTMQYLGIPVQLQCDVLASNSIKFYLHTGGEISYAVSNRYRIHNEANSTVSDGVNSPQLSAGLGIGVEFKISNHIGLYLNPAVNYYFNCHQPKSIRTDKPLMVDLNAGLRVNL